MVELLASSFEQRMGPGLWLTTRNSRLAALKQSSDGEVDSALARGADAARDRNGAHNGVGDNPQVEGSAHHHRAGIVAENTESSSRFIPSAPVNFSSHELRQTVELASKSQRGIGVVISQEFTTPMPRWDFAASS